MPSEVVKNRIVTEQGREIVTVMDDYGTELHIYIPVADTAFRQARIDAAIAQQTANTAALESYASTHSIDLSEQRAAGLAKKAKLKGK